MVPKENWGLLWLKNGLFVFFFWGEVGVLYLWVENLRQQMKFRIHYLRDKIWVHYFLDESLGSFDVWRLSL
jgi:hypothetical protein